MKTYRADTDLKAVLLFTMELRREFFHGVYGVGPWVPHTGRLYNDRARRAA